MKRLVAIVLLVAACGAPAASVAPSLSHRPAATPAPTPAPTASPTLSRPATAAAHITISVTELMNLTSDDAIAAWISKESEWLNAQPNLPVLRPYTAALTGALIDLIYMDEVPTNLGLTVLDIIAAARQVPGVDLP